MSYYELLGISKDATKEEIKAAYLALAKQWHPDLHPDNPEGAAQKFKEIHLAYEMLNEPEVWPITGIFTKSNIGGDLFHHIYLTLEEINAGLNIEITTSRKTVCNNCQGTGFSSFKKCDVCDGKGQTSFNYPPFQAFMPCGRCMGAACLPKKVCSSCGGSGSDKTIDEVVPIRIESGYKDFIQFEGQGHFGKQKNGDLIVKIHMKPHVLFELDEFNNLHLDLPISYTQLVLGGEILITNLDKKEINLKIPAGTNPNTIIKLKNMGVSGADMYVRLVLEIPKDVSNKHRELLELVQNEQAASNASGDSIGQPPGSIYPC